MNDKNLDSGPSDRAIAQAFREYVSMYAGQHTVLDRVTDRAQALDTNPPAGARDAVTDDMVERACAAFYSDLAWRTNSNQSRDFMRSALEAALTGKADGGDAEKKLAFLCDCGEQPDHMPYGYRWCVKNGGRQEGATGTDGAYSPATQPAARPSATGSNLADKLAALAYKWEEQTRSARLLEATLINKHARELRALLADQPARSYDFSLIARMLRSYSGTTTAYANGDAVEAYALARQLPDAQPAPVVGGDARLEELAYVPGAWRCPKCGLRLMAQTLHTQDGGMSANNEPQACANRCGPMWRVTEREDRQDAQRFAIEQSEKLKALLSARPGGEAK